MPKVADNCWQKLMFMTVLLPFVLIRGIWLDRERRRRVS